MKRRLAAALIIGCLTAGPVAAGGPPAHDVRTIIARALPAVVSISTRPLRADDFGGRAPGRGLGSGVIVDSRGYIVTNYHVVDGGSDDIRVTLPDDRTFRARLIGADPAGDLAVIKVDAPRLPVLRLGGSEILSIGDPVIAIGNAMWIEGGPSVTAGIVSALDRSMEQPGLPKLHHLIQTDAAINPGNSGGPLINLRGEVVGINTALIPSAHGIGFAIAANAVEPIIAELIRTGRVVRRSLGLDVVSITAPIAHANELPVDRGVLVVGVGADQSREVAGVRIGDIIRRLDGVEVKNLHQFEDAIARQPIGREVIVELIRGRDVIRLGMPVLEAR